MPGKRITGAALKSKVVKEMRLYLSDYGLPMDNYDLSYYDEYSLGSDMQPTIGIRFRNQLGTCEIQIDSIWPADDGTILQHSAPELR
jgi:hypothetical protein